MNISLITSFAIGGLVLLSILALNRNMMLHSADSTVEIVNQYKSDELFELITHDLSRIGYGFPAPGDEVKIQQFKDDMIKFRADVLDDGVDEVLWQFPGSPVPQTPNPDDKRLMRRGSVGSGTPGNLENDFNVIDFKLTGYRDTNGTDETTDKDQIRSILVEIVYDSPNPASLHSGNQPEYHRRHWRKLIVPKNLQFSQF